MKYNEPTRMPTCFGAKAEIYTLQNANFLSDEELKRYYQTLITKEQCQDPSNSAPHSLILFTPQKVGLPSVRAICQNIDIISKHYNADILGSRIFGRGITEPAQRALFDAKQNGYDVEFVDLSGF